MNGHLELVISQHKMFINVKKHYKWDCENLLNKIFKNYS